MRTVIFISLLALVSIERRFLHLEKPSLEREFFLPCVLLCHGLCTRGRRDFE